MMHDYFLEKGPVTIVVIGAGNRTNKYLEYARMHPNRLQLVGIVEVNPNRIQHLAKEFGIDASRCFY